MNYLETDMRMAQNKTTQAQEQHLNQDRSEDMRSKEHREQLVDESGHRLNIDGSTDKRCNENKTETPVSEPSNQTDMRQKENRENMVDSEGHHLNVDGSLDIGCKENQEETNTPPSDEPQLDTNQTTQDGTDETNMAIPTKNYGTADMWYTASREAVASGAIEPDEQLIEENTTMPTGSDEGVSGQSALTDIPTKSDGTADMRFSASQDAVASGEISRDEVLAGGTMDSIGDALESSSNMIDSADSAAGPLKADGTPDMRFSANQE